jgi:hypothetical protein
VILVSLSVGIEVTRYKVCTLFVGIDERVGIADLNSPSTNEIASVQGNLPVVTARADAGVRPAVHLPA